MTREAGRQLDTLIAEKVFGLKIHSTDWPCWESYDSGEWLARSEDRESLAGTVPQPVYEQMPGDDDLPPLLAVVPDYSSDIADAWQVVEALAPTWQVHLMSLDRGWVCTLHTWTGIQPYRTHQKAADTAAEAICQAALSAALEPPR